MTVELDLVEQHKKILVQVGCVQFTWPRSARVHCVATGYLARYSDSQMLSQLQATLAAQRRSQLASANG